MTYPRKPPLDVTPPEVFEKIFMEFQSRMDTKPMWTCGNCKAKWWTHDETVACLLSHHQGKK